MRSRSFEKMQDVTVMQPQPPVPVQGRALPLISNEYSGIRAAVALMMDSGRTTLDSAVTAPSIEKLNTIVLPIFSNTV